MFEKSINKKFCENYLFEDYRLKSGIEKRIPNLTTSGSYPHFPKIPPVKMSI